MKAVRETLERAAYSSSLEALGLEEGFSEEFMSGKRSPALSIGVACIDDILSRGERVRMLGYFASRHPGKSGVLLEHLSKQKAASLKQEPDLGKMPEPGS